MINMSNLTIIYISAGQLPKHFSEYQWAVFLEAATGHQVLTVLREPGGDIHDTEPKSHLNMYRQLLKACKLATTDYIATAEDDALYAKEHFNFYRPPMDTIAYDMSRWSIYSWNPIIYSIKQRISNCTLLAPRLEYIDALEEKLSKLHEGNLHYVSEVGRYENSLGLRPRKVERVYCEVPVVHINHEEGTDPLSLGKRKRLGQLKAYDIPYWGKAATIMEEYR